MDCIEICKVALAGPPNIRNWSETAHEELFIAGTVEPFEVQILSALKDCLDVTLSGDAQLEFELRKITLRESKARIFRLIARELGPPLSVTTREQIRAISLRFFDQLSVGQSSCIDESTFCDLYDLGSSNPMVTSPDMENAIEAFKAKHHKRKRNSTDFYLMEGEAVNVSQIRAPNATPPINDTAKVPNLEITGFRRSTQEVFCCDQDGNEYILNAKRDPAAATLLNLVDRRDHLHNASLLISYGKTGKKAHAAIKHANYINAEQQSIKL